MKKLNLISILLAVVACSSMLILSFERFNLWLLSFIALVPLYWATDKSNSIIKAAIIGFITGSIYLTFIHLPLSSAHTWTGWVDFESLESDSNEYLLKQKNMLIVLCCIAGIIGGLCVALFTAVTKWSQSRFKLMHYLVFFPVAWVLIVEHLRRKILLNYEWANIGYPLIDLPQIAHYAAYGGISLLAFIVVAVNGFIYYFIVKSTSKLKTLTIGSLVAVITFTWGGWKISQPIESNSEINVAMIQFTKPNFNENDLSEFQMDKHYLNFVRNLYDQHADKFDMLVLPESIGFGSVTLDNSVSKNTPEKTLSSIKDWKNGLGPSISKSNAIFIHGMDTVSNGLDHNSLLVWNSQGPLYHYNKRELVPFAESFPEQWAFLGLKGKSTYSAGQNIGILKNNRVNLGFLICQEILFSLTALDSLKQGAEVFVTVGNDGVFNNATVAKINHRAARLRAIETQRYIIRSMRSGVSSVIKPSGEIRSSLAIGENGVLFSKIYPQTEMSIFSKIHNLINPILVSVFILFLALCFRKKI